MPHLVPLITGWVMLLLGALLSTFGAVQLQREITLSAKGVPAHGTVVDFALPKWSYLGASAEVDVEPPQAPPVRVHIDRASSMRDWRKGATLNVICDSLIVRGAACHVDDFADRWLEPVVLSVVGVLAAVMGGLMVLRA
jgi:hypothetical protein